MTRLIDTLLTLFILVGLVASAAAVALGFLYSEPLFLVGGCVGAVGWNWACIFAFGDDE